MPVYVSFLGHVELPAVDPHKRPMRPVLRFDDARVDHRPARGLRGRQEA